jgi:uncharacterized LabA/DUF88 family protein
MNFVDFIIGFPIRTFSLIVLGALGRNRVVGFLSKHGISIPGFRLDKVPDEILIETLYWECADDMGLLQLLQEELDRANREVMESLRRCKVKNVQKEIDRVDEIEDAGELSRYLWAALRDSRKKVNQVAVEIVAGIEGMLDMDEEEEYGAEVDPAEEEGGEEIAAPDKTRKKSGQFLEAGDGNEGRHRENEIDDGIVPETTGEAGRILSGLRQSGENWNNEVKKLEKYLKVVEARSEQDHRRAEKRKKDIGERDDQIRKLRVERKDLKKQIQLLKKEKSGRPEELIHKIDEMKSKLSALKRDNRKQDHQIKEGKKDREKIGEIRERLIRAGMELDSVRKKLKAKTHRCVELEKKIEGMEEQIIRLKEADKLPTTRRSPSGDRERIGIYLDSRNVYYTVRNTFDGGRVDIKELITRISRGRKVVRAIAYVVQADFDDKRAYFNMLGHNGFQVKRRDLKIRRDGSMKGDWDMGMALDLMRHYDHLDTIALVSGDGDFRDLAAYLKSQGVKIEVYGVDSCTALDLKQVADLFVPIDRKWLLRE